uniref:3-oxoacyl-[acyl-carrier-protein] synthase 2 n=1 Tax=Streptomyces sp. CNH287 TaxID=1288082 RepID=U6A476_9ACTN|nr:3-oxoacyl-acyl carrier protein synthase [Streptomyces sp. CNH287]
MTGGTGDTGAADAPPRVVVTGLGASTPVGGDVATSWAALTAGRSGVRKISTAWADELPVRIAGVAAEEPAERLAPFEVRRLDRVQQFALTAAREAWADAGSPQPQPERFAVAVASGGGGLQALLHEYDVLRESGWQRVSPLTLPRYMANGSAAWLSIEFGATAELHAPASACASGADALARGVELIRTGRVDVVLAGGAEAMIHPVVVAGFAAMRALSRRNDDPERACRPFDATRDGFVLGEGAGVLVLESAEHAERRGARVYGELAGFGRSADAFHIANPEPTGAGTAVAVARALADAGMDPADVAHVNAHATGTPQGDAAESAALRSALGPAAEFVSVTSTKSMTGHLLGAGGAVEAVATVLTLHHGVVPPTLNLETPEGAAGLDVVRGAARELPRRPAGALSNSFAFGGQNVSLAFRRSASAAG